MVPAAEFHHTPLLFAPVLAVTALAASVGSVASFERHRGFAHITYASADEAAKVRARMSSLRRRPVLERVGHPSRAAAAAHLPAPVPQAVSTLNGRQLAGRALAVEPSKPLAEKVRLLLARLPRAANASPRPLFAAAPPTLASFFFCVRVCVQVRVARESGTGDRPVHKDRVVVRNLPREFDSEKLSAVFKHIGTIVKAKVRGWRQCAAERARASPRCGLRICWLLGPPPRALASLFL